MTTTEKEAAIALLHKLIDMRVENCALKGVVSMFKRAEENSLLDWRPLVEEVLANGIVRDDVRAKYAHIEESLRAQSDSDSAVLKLLDFFSE